MGVAEAPKLDCYADFVSDWLSVLCSHMKRLQNALNANAPEKDLRILVQDMQDHIEKYFSAKKSAVCRDVLKILSPEWETNLEKSLMWIGGFRPGLIFQLLYSQAGQELEAGLASILQGIDITTLATLSAEQMQRINDLQVKVNEEERNLSHRMEEVQESVVNEPFLTLAKLHTELSEEKDSPMVDAVEHSVKRMEEIVDAADALRRRTLFDIIDILTPHQVAQFLVSAAQLQIGLREIGELQMVDGF